MASVTDDADGGMDGGGGDDPSGGAGLPAPGGPPNGSPPPGAGAPGGGIGGPGGILAALARHKQGPQVSAPGPGNMADSMNQIASAINMIQQAALGLPPGSPLHKDALQAAQRLSRHLGQSTMGPAAGIQKTQLGDMLRRTVQNMMLQRILSQQGQGQPGGDAAGQGGGGGAPPMPSTPLPGS